MGQIYLNGKPHPSEKVFLYYWNREALGPDGKISGSDVNGDHWINLEELNGDVLGLANLAQARGVIPFFAENSNEAKKQLAYAQLKERTHIGRMISSLPLEGKPYSGTMETLGLGRIADSIAAAQLTPQKSLPLFSKLVTVAKERMKDILFEGSRCQSLERIARAMIASGLRREVFPVLESALEMKTRDGVFIQNQLANVMEDLEAMNAGEEGAPLFQKMFSLVEEQVNNAWTRTNLFTLIGGQAKNRGLKEISREAFNKAEVVALQIDPSREDKVLWQNIANAKKG